MSPYAVYVKPEALAAAKHLPGNLRQRVKRSIDGFGKEPRPPDSKPLGFPDSERFPGPGVEVRRLRVDKWRVVYTIREEGRVVNVLAIRKRPPYDYGDLQELLRNLAEEPSSDNS